MSDLQGTYIASGSPTFYYDISYSETNRSSSSVTFKIDIAVSMGYSESKFGYALKGYVSIGGNEVLIVDKGQGTSGSNNYWTGTAKHYYSSSITCNTNSSNGTLSASFRTTRPGGEGSAGLINKSGLTVNKSSYTPSYLSTPIISGIGRATFPKSGNVQLKWSPVSGATHYFCYAACNNTQTIVYDTNTNRTYMNWSIKDITGYPQPGDQIYFYVQAVGESTSSKWGEYHLPLENSSPDEGSEGSGESETLLSYVSVSGSVQSGSSAYVEVKYSAASGATVEYGISSGGIPSSWSSLGPSPTFVQVTSLQNYVYVRATKNKKTSILHDFASITSSSGSGTITPTTPPPTISTIYITGQSVKSKGGKNLVKKIDLQVIATNANSYLWQIKKGDVFQTIPNNSSSSIRQLDVSNFCDKGQQIIIKVTATNRNGSVSQTKTSEFYCPKDMPDFKIINCHRIEEQYNTNIASNYFNKKMRFEIDYPNIDEQTGVPLKSLQITDQNDAVLKNLNIDEQKPQEDLEITIPFEGKINFKIKAIDIFGQEKIIPYDSIDGFTRLKAYSAKTAMINGLSKKITWEVNTEDLFSEDQSFTFSAFFPINYNKAIQGNLTYKVDVKLDNKNYLNLISFDQNLKDLNPPEKGEVNIQLNTQSETNYTVNYTFYGNNYYLFKKLEQIGIWDTDYFDVTFRIRIENAFGECAEEKEIIGNIITTSAPFFVNNSLALYRGYSKNKTLEKNNFITFPLINSDSSESERTINPQEILGIQLESFAKDKNDIEGETTINKYKIYYREVGKNSWHVLKEIGIIPTGYNDGKPYWNIITPKINLDDNSERKIEIGIKAVDETNKESNILQCTDYLFYGNRIAPSLTIQKINLTLSSENTPSKISLNLFPNNLGGNKLIKKEESGEKEDIYTCNNFLREDSDQGGLIQQGYLTILYSNDPEMKTSVYETNDIKELSYLSSIQAEKKSLLVEFYLDKNFVPASTFYIQLKLEIDTNNYYSTDFTKNQSNMPLYTYYQDSPVFSCRPHWIGVNTSDWNQNSEILQIKPAGINQNIINLYCDGGKKITIDLKNNIATFGQIKPESIKASALIESKDLTISNKITASSIKSKIFNGTNATITTLESEEIKGATIDGGSWDEI